jgi:hypothetical protein
MNDADVVLELLEAIGDVEGVAPHELEYPLYEYVDPEAIRGLVAMDNDGWELTFSVPDHEVRVGGDGEIRIDGEVVRRIDRVTSERR